MRALSKSVIEDKADAKLILSNRKGSEGKPEETGNASAAPTWWPVLSSSYQPASRTEIKPGDWGYLSLLGSLRSSALDPPPQIPRGPASRHPARVCCGYTRSHPLTSVGLSVIRPFMDSTTVFSATDVVVATDAAVPSADAAVGTTDVVTLTDVVTCRSRADSRVLLRRGGETRPSQQIKRLYCVCGVIRLLRAHRHGVLLRDDSAPPTCRNMMHYKLLTISYEDLLVAVGGSANMTKAAWSNNDEFVIYVEGPAAISASLQHNSLPDAAVSSRRLYCLVTATPAHDLLDHSPQEKLHSIAFIFEIAGSACF
ncbi:Phospholipase D-like domain [Phytophthora cactorum]|nr:Phospholipase D-like domain [Phytophthora cactorum]